MLKKSLEKFLLSLINTVSSDITFIVKMLFMFPDHGFISMLG